MKEAIYIEKEKTYYDVIYGEDMTAIDTEDLKIYPDLDTVEDAIASAKTILYVMPDIYYVGVIKTVYNISSDGVSIKSSDLVWEGIARDKDEIEENDNELKNTKVKMYS